VKFLFVFLFPNSKFSKIYSNKLWQVYFNIVCILREPNVRPYDTNVSDLTEE